VDLEAEVERLRTMLDRVPACLLRVSSDGTLLAVNDAALSLLRVHDLCDVLGTNFVERLDHNRIATIWPEFVDRVEQSGSASFECELIDPVGDPRAVLLLGARLPLHPDSHPSVFVVVRDVSSARRLEASLHGKNEASPSDENADDAATVRELKRQLAQAHAERREMEQALAAEVMQRQHISTAVEHLSRALASATKAAGDVCQALEKDPHR
jgi:hypothetical protein